jgi:hypothetical protein
MPAELSEDQRRKIAGLSAAVFVYITVASAAALVAPYNRTPYHNSAFRGMDWVNELLEGHPDRIKNELGMRKHVFLALCFALQLCSLKATQEISVEEQVAIFLYMSVTGLSVVHVAERFQRAFSTISMCASPV